MRDSSGQKALRARSALSPAVAQPRGLGWRIRPLTPIKHPAIGWRTPQGQPHTASTHHDAGEGSSREGRSEEGCPPHLCLCSLQCPHSEQGGNGRGECRCRPGAAAFQGSCRSLTQHARRVPPKLLLAPLQAFRVELSVQLSSHCHCGRRKQEPAGEAGKDRQKRFGRAGRRQATPPAAPSAAAECACRGGDSRWRRRGVQQRSRCGGRSHSPATPLPRPLLRAPPWVRLLVPLLVALSRQQ